MATTPRNHREIKAASGKERMRILFILSHSKDAKNVKELSKIMGDFSISRVSHQLRILRKFGFVKGQRNGKSIMYAVTGLHEDHVTFRD